MIWWFRESKEDVKKNAQKTIKLVRMTRHKEERVKGKKENTKNKLKPKNNREERN